MIAKEYLKQINPDQFKDNYNPKYSEGTYKFLHKYKNKDIRVYWNKRNNIDGSMSEFNPNDKTYYPTQIYFIYKENGDHFGALWSNIMQNKYGIYDCINKMEYLEDITEFFMDIYLKIGRCMFDTEHINFLLGKNHEYVKTYERFEIIDGIKKCKWCGKTV